MTALIVENLQKVYANGTLALRGINFCVGEGDFFALLGKNGAGKSTTIGIISSLVKKTAGTVKVFGYDLNDSTIEAKSLMGIMPQEINLGMYDTVLNSLIYQAGYYGVKRKIAQQRANHLLEAMSLLAVRDQQIVRLSGGMKRRLMVARALINCPKLLILDEPSAGVDIELRYLLWDFLRELNTQEGTTIILTTHYLEEAEALCKNLAIIDNGQIIENDSMKSLLSRMAEYTIELDFALPLRQTPQIADYALVVVDELTAVVTIKPGQHLNRLFALLSEQQILVNNVRNKSNRLATLFLNLTNQHNHKQGNN
jgi:ABC-2 type transport system ATP-binding protein